jgi:hypothetical protein
MSRYLNFSHLSRFSKQNFAPISCFCLHVTNLVISSCVVRLPRQY